MAKVGGYGVGTKTTSLVEGEAGLHGLHLPAWRIPGKQNGMASSAHFGTFSQEMTANDLEKGIRLFPWKQWWDKGRACYEE